MFNTIPIKIPMAYLTDQKQILQKFIWNHKRHQTASAILRKKNKVGGIILPDVKLTRKPIGIKTALWAQEQAILITGIKWRTQK